VTITKRTVEYELAAAHAAIERVLGNSELLRILQPYGYTPERLREGLALRGRIKQLHSQQQVQYSLLSKVTQARALARETTNHNYRRHIAIARIAFAQDRAVLQRLDVLSQRKKTLAGQSLQATHFYETALAEPMIVQQLERFGLPRQELELGLQQIALLEQHEIDWQQQQETAKRTTRLRNDARAELQAWMHHLQITAQAAIKKNGVLQMTWK
jgi:hypothetical protein